MSDELDLMYSENPEDDEYASLSEIAYLPAKYPGLRRFIQKPPELWKTEVFSIARQADSLKADYSSHEKNSAEKSFRN